ncbi:MAG TPA: Na+/H+ antiporter subunit E [Pseudolabrys sp.]|jgi:multicomponent Na+:H+ antiporter subunit E|nr:Na+/H+ antiporter subunit E [Pseudolabrys sp.]
MKIVRLGGFLVFWVIIAGTEPVDLLFGAPAALIVTWASLQLLPPGTRRLRVVALARLVPRFLYQSIGAGVDVAWRALDPRLSLQPGFVTYRPRLPPGAALSAFCTVTSLLPGTLPSGTDESGRLMIHCLDKDQPIANQLATEEALLMEALGYGSGND